MTFDILGKQVNATFDQELAEAIRRAWLPTASLENAMKTVAQEALKRGHEINTDSVRDFLLSLQLAGLLKVVEDPWSMFGLDRIKMALYGPTAPAGWNHVFIWSSEAPQIASINADGVSVIRTVYMAKAPEPGYQEQWIAEHLRNLRR